MAGTTPEQLQEAIERLCLRPDVPPLTVRWFDTVPSTMDLVADAADAGHPAGLVVLAEQQTAGRGRRGRDWTSPPSAGLYFSYLARPTRHVELLTLAAGVGVVEGIAATTGFRAELKWPNDVMVGSRKLAGVLAEGRGIGTTTAAVIVGVGLNIATAAYPPDVAARAIALETELGRPVDRYELFASVLERLAACFSLLEQGRSGDILQAWRAASPSATGTRVAWSEGGADREGTTAGIDDSGALLVRTREGTERIVGGELQWSLRS